MQKRLASLANGKPLVQLNAVEYRLRASIRDRQSSCPDVQARLQRQRR
jgi:hypothetical protein